MGETALKIWNTLNEEWFEHIAWNIYKNLYTIQACLKQEITKITIDRLEQRMFQKTIYERTFYKNAFSLNLQFNPRRLVSPFNTGMPPKPKRNYHSVSLYAEMTKGNLDALLNSVKEINERKNVY